MFLATLAGSGFIAHELASSDSILGYIRKYVRVTTVSRDILGKLGWQGIAFRGIL